MCIHIATTANVVRVFENTRRGFVNLCTSNTLYVTIVGFTPIWLFLMVLEKRSNKCFILQITIIAVFTRSTHYQQKTILTEKYTAMSLVL